MQVSKKFEVIKWKRTGMSRFEKSVPFILTEDQVKMHFPAWKGEFVYHVGRHIFHINEIV